MKLNLLNLEGGKSETIDVSDKIMNLKFNHKLVKYVIDWQLNHQKPRTAKTKQRNKGTGQARHASKKAPLFVGGGQAHGPKGAVYKIKKINKKVRKLALAQTIAKKNVDKQLYILSDVTKEVKKTKDFNKFLNTNKLSNVLIVSDKNSEKNFVKSARNIKNIKVIRDEGANIYDMLKFTNVVITSSSMKNIETRILDEKN